MTKINDMTTKQEDMTSEQELAKFLDLYLYDKLKSKCKSINRITDKNQQIEGMDVIIEYDNGNSVIIDEKAQLHYMDACTNTFVFEVNFIGSNGDRRLGWLFNDALKTDTYMLIWPQKTIYNDIINSIDGKSEKSKKIREIVRNIKFNDFEVVECYLIKRETVKKYLASNGWDRNTILKQANDLINSNKYDRTFLPGIDSFYFYFSKPHNYKESPVNIIIKKNVLKHLAYKKYIVTKKDLKII